MFWIALLPWFWMSQIGLDDADCSTWGANYALCVMRKMVNAHQPQGVREPARDELSPKIWILALPLLFLTFVTQIAYIIGPDFGTFADVFIVWALMGLAALIMLLAMRLGSRKRMAPPMEQARIHI